jgi:hypothetical protein
MRNRASQSAGGIKLVTSRAITLALERDAECRRCFASRLKAKPDGTVLEPPAVKQLEVNNLRPQARARTRPGRCHPGTSHRC